MRLLRQEDLERIAVGCLYLLTDKGVVEFPTSTRAHPSEFVVVYRSPGPPLRDGDETLFPFRVLWDIWEGIVVPVLRSPEIQYRNVITGARSQSNALALSLKDYNTYLSRILSLLMNGLRARGYLPPNPSGTMTVETMIVNPGEPEVGVSDGQRGDPRFPVLDNQLTWIEYPPVE